MLTSQPAPPPLSPIFSCFDVYIHITSGGQEKMHCQVVRCIRRAHLTGVLQAADDGATVGERASKCTRV